MSRAPLVSSPVAPAHPAEAILGIGYEMLISAEATGGAYEVMRFTVPPGAGPPPHIHHREAECFFIEQGDFEILLAGETRRATAGSIIHLPPHVPHAFRNAGTTTGRFTCWVVPGNLGPFFNAFKRPWPADEAEPPPVTQEDIARLMAAAAAHEMEILAGN